MDRQIRRKPMDLPSNPLNMQCCRTVAIRRLLNFYARAAPSAAHCLRASSSGVWQHITLSQPKTAPADIQACSKMRIHSPSPQPYDPIKKKVRKRRTWVRIHSPQAAHLPLTDSRTQPRQILQATGVEQNEKCVFAEVSHKAKIREPFFDEVLSERIFVQIRHKTQLILYGLKS